VANEITLGGSIAYSDSENTEDALTLTDVVKSVSTKRIAHLKQNVGTSEEAVKLGDLSAPGYALFVNRDPTNYIELKVATSGAIFAKLDPDTNSDGKGGFALLKLGSGAQAPYAIANTGACQMEIFLIDT
jgi:hypothetical protein